MTNFVSGSISIGADLIMVQKVLVEYRHIQEWERGFDSFKELHVADGMKTIVHWDVEYDIDYSFSVTKNEGGVLLELMVAGLTMFPDGKYKLEEMRYYVDTVLCRIKAISEKFTASKSC